MKIKSVYAGVGATCVINKTVKTAIADLSQAIGYDPRKPVCNCGGSYLCHSKTCPINNPLIVTLVCGE